MAEHVIVGVTVGGSMWTAFERISAAYSAKHAARAFSFTATDDTMSFNDAWSFMPGTPVTVTANGDLMVTGFIDKMSPSYDAKHHHIEVSGRSKSADTVDSSAVHDKSEFKNKTPVQIANELGMKVGVTYKALAKMKPIEWHRINPGETIHDCVERACRKQQIRLMGTADGNVTLVDDVFGSNTPLIEGENILAATANFDDSDSHSEYKVHGQRTFHTRKGDYRIEAKESNSRVKRSRPKVIRTETDVTKDEAEKRAKHQKNTANGEAVTANVKVQGWHDSDGALWQANGLVYVYSPMLKLDRMMGISSVNCTQEAKNGSFTTLALVLPEALGNAKGGGEGKNNGSAWKSGK